MRQPPSYEGTRVGRRRGRIVAGGGLQQEDAFLGRVRRDPGDSPVREDGAWVNTRRETITRGRWRGWIALRSVRSEDRGLVRLPDLARIEVLFDVNSPEGVP